MIARAEFAFLRLDMDVVEVHVIAEQSTGCSWNLVQKGMASTLVNMHYDRGKHSHRTFYREIWPSKSESLSLPACDGTRIGEVEREKGFEPSTSCLEGKHSATELLAPIGCSSFSMARRAAFVKVCASTSR